MRVTIRLRERRDRDLVDWINSLEEGDRSEYIRNVLRKGLSNNGANFATAQAIKIEPKEVKTDEIKEVDLEERLNDWI